MLHEKPQASILLEMDISVCDESSNYYYYYFTSGTAQLILSPFLSQCQTLTQRANKYFRHLFSSSLSRPEHSHPLPFISVTLRAHTSSSFISVTLRAHTSSSLHAQSTHIPFRFENLYCFALFVLHTHTHTHTSKAAINNNLGMHYSLPSTSFDLTCL